MNVHYLLPHLIIFNLIGNNLPSILYLAGYSDKCNASENRTLFFGFLFSITQLTYLIPLIRICIKASSPNQSEAPLIQASPKLFPTFIYQLYFVALTSISNPTGHSPCFSIRIQQFGFKVSSGIYAFIWLRGILFGYYTEMKSRLLMIAMQVSVFLATFVLQYSITSYYGNDTLNECIHIPHANLFLIVTIFAVISLSYTFFKLGALGFILSLPICQLLWQPDYMIKAFGRIIENSSGDFDIAELLSKRCPYHDLDYILWSLPFVLWFLMSLLMTLVRVFFLHRVGPPFTEVNPQHDELFRKGSPLKEKTYGKHKLPVRIADEKKCTICWEEFSHNEKVSFVEECFHIYHSACINKWITKENHCPLCKRKIKMKIF